jgi:hypothetical protein
MWKGAMTAKFEVLTQHLPVWIEEKHEEVRTASLQDATVVPTLNSRNLF